MKEKKTGKKKSTHGFTLVETIVVLMIIAILASMVIPSMIGWIAKAEEKKLVVEARGIYLAAQGALTEQYGESSSFADRATKFHSQYGDTGRISNNMMYYVQREPNNSSYLSDKQSDAAIAKSILQLLDSEKYSTARYQFKSRTAPVNGQSVTNYQQRNQGQPGITLLYNAHAEIVCLEFGYDGYLCRIYDGDIKTIKNGKYTTYGTENH